MGSLECREKTQLPSPWDSVSLKKKEDKKNKRERERELVGNPCLTAAVMLNVGLFYFTDCGKQRHRVTPLLLCEAMNLHICLEEAKPRRLCT